MTKRRQTGGPTRTCVGCGRRDAQSSLLRLRRGDDVAVVVATRIGSGRSAYVHGRSDCVLGLLRSKGLGKSLRMTVARDARMELMHSLDGTLASGDLVASRSRRGSGTEA